MRRVCWLIPLLIACTGVADEATRIERPEAFKMLVKPTCPHCQSEAKHAVVYQPAQQGEDRKGEDKKGENKKASDAVKEIAGSAEFLLTVPKKFATLKGIDVAHNTVTLRADGENEDRTWPLIPDAEIKVHGWWGRLSQFAKTPRVWVFFHVDRAKKPVAIFMLADELSEQCIHGGGSADKSAVIRKTQQAWLRTRWIEQGLPGTLGLLHVYNGEADVILDHEAMRWGRSLKRGDKVELAADPPIKAVVKSVYPEREKTRVRLVAKTFDLAELKTGQRMHFKMNAPPSSVDDDPVPPDADRPRSKAERIDWFLASIYCTCTAGSGDKCTGNFYTLASCNPNGCGMPNTMRKLLAKKIDEGLTDREIFEQLIKDKGPLLQRPHLVRETDSVKKK